MLENQDFPKDFLKEGPGESLVDKKYEKKFDKFCGQNENFCVKILGLWA